MRPILEVCDRETGYKVGGRLRETWWRQTASRKQLVSTLKYITAASRERCWKSGRRGESGGGDRDAEESDNGSGRDGSWYAGMETGDYQVGK